MTFGGQKLTAELDIDLYILADVLRPFQDYFSSYETGQSVDGAKMGEPQEKPPDRLACRIWIVSRAPCGARAHNRHSGEMIK